MLGPGNSRVPKAEALPESLGREQSDCHLDTESMVCCRGGNHDFSKVFSSFTERKKKFSISKNLFALYFSYLAKEQNWLKQFREFARNHSACKGLPWWLRR